MLSYFYYNKNLYKLPLVFNKVTGYFTCASNRLLTLEGCPKEVGGNFHCDYNPITSLRFSPEKVGGSFYCINNRIKSFEGFLPNISGQLHITFNPIHSLYTDYIIKPDNIELFNEYRIIEGDKIYLKRLMNYIRINKYSEPNISSLETKGYKIIS